MKSSVLLFAVILLVGCGDTGPPSTHTRSSQFATLEQRVEFLNRYVSFRRTCETLDFDIDYQNNGGGWVPGPSEWDIRLIATVPAGALPDWIPPGVRPCRTHEVEPAPTLWLSSIPTSIDPRGIDEWYPDRQRLVGIDRKRRLVVWRVSTDTACTSKASSAGL